MTPLEYFLIGVAVAFLAGLVAQFLYTARKLEGLSTDMGWIKQIIAEQQHGVTHAELVVRVQSLERTVYALQDRRQYPRDSPGTPPSPVCGG